MRDYFYINWNKGEARLKNYSAATSARGGSIVKIEIEVFDTSRLGYLIQELADIKRSQDLAAKEAAKPKARKLPSPPRLLTYQGGE